MGQPLALATDTPRPAARSRPWDALPGGEPMTDPPSAMDDASLVQRLRSGDREALGELYDRHAPVAQAVALRIVGDREQAEDLVHDAFVIVWQKIARFDASRGSLRAWLLTIVRNRGIDRLRATRPALDLDEGDLPSGPNPTWDEAIRRLSAAEIRSAVDGLPAEQRNAIELAYFSGRTYREIAQITGVPQGTVNGRMRLALVKLREALAGGDAAPMSSVPNGHPDR
jgi:RNA polymerase sigma-70 factor, ECF subfamily